MVPDKSLGRASAPMSDTAVIPLVRIASSDEVDTIRNLMRSVIESALAPEHRAPMVENLNANVDLWLRRPGDCVHLVAVVDDRIVGVILVKDFWNLCSLFVEESCQGTGIGKALVGRAIDLCRSRSSKAALLLNAAPSAIPFYTRLGFTARESQQVLPPGFQAMRLPL